MLNTFVPVPSGEALQGLFKRCIKGPFRTVGLGVQVAIEPVESSGILYVSFQCTRSLGDWFFNLLGFSNPAGQHFGLYWLASSGRKKIRRLCEKTGLTRIVVSGYSQGAALAAYTGEHLLEKGFKVSLCRFASPKLYRKSSVLTKELYKGTLNVVVDGDPVTMLPPGWVELGKNLELPKVGGADIEAPRVMPEYHEAGVYRKGLENLEEQNGT